jgi:hypothetical protein
MTAGFWLNTGRGGLPLPKNAEPGDLGHSSPLHVSEAPFAMSSGADSIQATQVAAQTRAKVECRLELSANVLSTGPVRIVRRMPCASTPREGVPISSGSGLWVHR